MTIAIAMSDGASLPRIRKNNAAAAAVGRKTIVARMIAPPRPGPGTSERSPARIGKALSPPRNSMLAAISSNSLGQRRGCDAGTAAA